MHRHSAGACILIYVCVVPLLHGAQGHAWTAEFEVHFKACCQTHLRHKMPKLRLGVLVVSSGCNRTKQLCAVCPVLSTVTKICAPALQDVFRAVLYADLDFTSPPWDVLSADVKDLVQALLERDPAKRISAADALKHRQAHALHVHLFMCCIAMQLPRLSLFADGNA